MKRTKKTKTRDAVIQIIKAYPYPLSLSELKKLLNTQLPGVAFSTIYRIAKQLEADQLIQRVDWRERGSQYEWTGRLHHHHILCSVCGTTADFDDSAIQFDRAMIAAQTGFLFSQHHIALEGICPTCQQNGPAADQPAA